MNEQVKKRGFAAMDKDKQREIARSGGKAIATKSDHMKEIGKLGGKKTSQNRDHMAEIGRRGGLNSRKKAQ